MQYVLGVGFIAEKYRKNPKVRIFLDDLLVDEYEVENHKSLDRFLETDRLNYKFVNQEAVPPWTIVKKIKEQGETATWSRKASETTWPRHFKLYTIDDNVLQGKQHIRLEIENNDSNYTNGFMTRSTLLDLRHIFLLPKNFLKYFRQSLILELFWENTIEYKKIKKNLEYIQKLSRLTLLRKFISKLFNQIEINFKS